LRDVSGLQHCLENKQQIEIDLVHVHREYSPSFSKTPIHHMDLMYIKIDVVASMIPDRVGATGAEDARGPRDTLPLRQLSYVRSTVVVTLAQHRHVLSWRDVRDVCAFR
jgi:hypothetical protein